ECGIDGLEGDPAVDDRADPPTRDLAHGHGHGAPRTSERAEDPDLLLEQLHEVDGSGYARSRAAGDDASAALQCQHGAGEGFRPDMLEDDIDALLSGKLADHPLESVLAII